MTPQDRRKNDNRQDKQMKALSIKEPYASLILNGMKTIETRTWRTKYRGKILLCASKKPKSDISGKAFATAEIVDCWRMTKANEVDAHCKVYPNAWAWELVNITPIKPFKVKGKLGIFEVSCQAIDRINKGER